MQRKITITNPAQCRALAKSPDLKNDETYKIEANGLVNWVYESRLI